ncbi:MAG: MCE-family protein [Solirubrobacterales bacterium]|nr:MCE-family protein [Solirubrobacterales bacterium]
MRALAIAALLLVVFATAMIYRGAGSDHTLHAAFDAAVQIVPGQEVRIAGRKIGHISSVREVDGDAVVDLSISDRDWPLRHGTVARLHYGSVSGYAGRFVSLSPGPAAAPPLADGSVLSTAATITPVEFDQIFNTFDAPTRANLAGVLDETADTVEGHGQAIAAGLRDGSRGLQEYADFAHDLGGDPSALRTLVRAGARTTSTLRAQDTALRALLSRAAGTFDELALRAAAQKAALQRLPGTLHTAQGTLAHLDRSLVGLQALVTDLAPGARALSAVAPSIRRTAGTLLTVAPRATATLRAGTRAAPRIDRLLRAGTTFLPRSGSVLKTLAPMVGCVRPYAPEIAGTASTWTGFAGTDSEGGYGRVDLTQLPPGVAAGSPLSSQQVTSTFKDRVFYAMPRPPGLDAGHPWLLPECGAGADALDASKDPERRTGR